MSSFVYDAAFWDEFASNGSLPANCTLLTPRITTVAVLLSLKPIFIFKLERSWDCTLGAGRFLTWSCSTPGQKFLHSFDVLEVMQSRGARSISFAAMPGSRGASHSR